MVSWEWNISSEEQAGFRQFNSTEDLVIAHKIEDILKIRKCYMPPGPVLLNASPT